MFRYISLTWNVNDAKQVASATQIVTRLRSSGTPWTVSLARDGLNVFCSGQREKQNQVYRFSDGRGVILGKLFRRQPLGTPSGTVSGISEQDTQRIHLSGGHYLSQTFWGRYVTFWQDDSATFAFRDPSGTFPCFEVNYNGVRIYFSWLQDCIDGTGIIASINWDYIRAMLPLTIISGRVTALREVTQLLQGEETCIKSGVVTKQLCWDPHHIANSDRIEDPKLAAQLLRTVTRDCINHWAAAYDSILLRLSGGLDSSIVANCLRDAPSGPSVTCFTHFTERAESDERHYARLVASASAFEILEHKQSYDDRLDDLVLTAPLAIPRHCAPAIGNDRIEAIAARNVNATAIFSGGGGDQIFYQSNLELAATDYLALKGLRPGVFSVALSAARAERTSVWFVLRDAVKDYQRQTMWMPSNSIADYKRLVPRELIETTLTNLSMRHPWATQMGRNPPGKAFHIYTLATSPDYYDPRGQEDDAEYVRPLWSQPLIETALRIPTYVLTCGGWDRALARRAFREDLPSQISQRKTKGFLEECLKDIIRKNLGFLRSSLLGGALAQHGLLDQRKLSEALSDKVTLEGTPALELLDYLSIEHWVRNWEKS